MQRAIAPLSGWSERVERGRAAGALVAAALSALLAACSLGNAATPETVEAPARAMRIVSLDYCADQYVLKLVGRERILALSPDAGRDFSYMRASARGMPRVAPRAEDVLVLKPDLVVRSYGGGADAGTFFARAGVPVLQLGYAEDLAGVRRVLLETAAGLGETARGEKVARGMDARMATLERSLRRNRAKGREIVRPSLLYATPGGVTSGPGSLIHELVEAAGYRNFQTRPGWQPLPLERLAYEKPDRVAMAWFGRRDYNPDRWSAARHPLMARASDQPPIGLEGAWTACGGWFVLDAAEAMARASGADLP
jgi:iron complex transport system substrate-binding protein